MEDWQKKYITNKLEKLIDCTNIEKATLAHFRGKILSPSDCDKLLTTLKNDCAHSAAYDFYHLAMTRRGAYDILIDVFSSEFQLQTEPADILVEGKKIHRRQNMDGKFSAETRPITDNSVPPHVDFAKLSNSDQTDSSKVSPIPGGSTTVDSIDGNIILHYTTSVYNPLEVVVQPPKIDMRSQFENKYNLDYDDKGLALIINIKWFENTKLPTRQGSEKDMKNLRKLWGQLGYTIVRESEIDSKDHTWYKHELEKLIEEFRVVCDVMKPKSIVVYIGSHGEFNKILTSDAPPESQDTRNDDHGKVCLYENIVSKFYDKNCPGLKGRPKMFFISACQIFVVEKDSLSEPLPPPVSDLIVCTAQVPGFVAYRDSQSGSWLAHCLTYVVMNYAREKSLQEILEMVRDIMKNLEKRKLPGLEHGQIPQVPMNEMEKLYFFIRHGSV